MGLCCFCALICGGSQMATNSKIEWTDHTFNPWLGCTKVTPGCDHCYAEGWAKRSGLVKWGKNPRKRTTEAYWRNPLLWNLHASQFYGENKRRQRVFCASLADVFDNQVDPAWRCDLFSLIRKCSGLDWLLLTKRPQNIARMLPADWNTGYPNVWLGTTAEDQLRFNQRWRYLAAAPAIVRFISYEPAIGPLRLPQSGPYPNWIITGGESGGAARTIQPQWIRDLLSDCRRNGVAGFHKQWGSYKSNPLVCEDGLSINEAKLRDPFGKGGGLVDGEIVRNFPNCAPSLTAAA
jgi:protein gp37